MTDLRALLVLLEGPRRDAGLDGETERLLVAYGATAWSDWWASKALDWVEQGVWSEDVADALRQCSTNKTYSQHTRHRAWHYLKQRGLASVCDRPHPSATEPPGALKPPSARRLPVAD